MTTGAEIHSEMLAANIKQMLLDRRCWNVACGGCVGTTFQMALGKKLRRGTPLRNPAASEAFREFEGEYGLLVWCSWRLERPGHEMTSSEDEDDSRRDEALRSLAGRTVRSVNIAGDWHLRIGFDDESSLTVFPDHVGPSAVIDSNWEAWSLQRRYEVDSKLTCQVRDRHLAGAAEQAVMTLASTIRSGATPRRGHKNTQSQKPRLGRARRARKMRQAI